MRHWFSAAADAVVGYVEVAGLRVVAGAPVAAVERLGAVAEEFEADSLAAGRQVCYFAAENRLLEEARHRRYSRHLLGLQPTWSAGNWSERFDACASLRAQRNRALNKGVRVEEADSARERGADLRACHDAWMASKGLPQLGFVAHSDPSGCEPGRAATGALADRRLFIATARLVVEDTADRRQANAVVGYLSASPVPRRRGWLVEKIVRRPDAPNGTAELLVDSALRTLAGDAERFTLGLSPLASRPTEERAGSSDEVPAWLEFARRLAVKRGQRLYDFAGLNSFKSKFRPESWEPVYLLSTQERLTPRTFLALAGAFLGADGQTARTEAAHQQEAYRGWWSMPS